MKTGTAIEVIGYREVLNAVYGEGCPTASAFCGNALHLQKSATGIVPLVDLGVKIVGTGIEHVGYREVLNAVYGKGCPTASAFCGNALQRAENISPHYFSASVAIIYFFFFSALGPRHYDSITLFHDYSITVLLYYSITLLLYYSITVLLYYSRTFLLYDSITLLLSYSTILLLYYSFTLLLDYSIITLLLYYSTILLLYYSTTLLLSYALTLLLFAL